MNLEDAASTERFALRGMAGYRSLARHVNVSLDKVMQHAANGTLRALIPLEKRGWTRKSAVVTAGHPRSEAGAAHFVGQAEPQ
jgi:hypothetical protein